MTREQVVAVLLGVLATRVYLWLKARRDRIDKGPPDDLSRLQPGTKMFGPFGEQWVVELLERRLDRATGNTLVVHLRQAPRPDRPSPTHTTPYGV